MSFADLVEEVRQLPSSSKIELRNVIQHELSEEFQDEILRGHLEAEQLKKEGKLPPFTSDVDELIRRLEADD
jgi:hypothetical protein